MNKSKFKSVKFKPMQTSNRYSWESAMGVIQWTFHYGDLKEGTGFCTFTEDYIDNNPELFEVEKAEREFEYWACYKAKFASCSDWEIIRYCGDSGFARFGLNQHFRFASFHEIGEKIEL